MENTNDWHATPPSKRSLRWKTGLFFALFIILSFYLDFHLAILGYLRNEPCYRGLPATYWRARSQATHRWNRIRYSEQWNRIRSRGGWTTRTAIKLLDKISRHSTLDEPIKVGDKQSVPVLLFLVKDSDSEIRWTAVSLLGYIDPPNEVTIAAIADTLDDSDGLVRQSAAWAWVSMSRLAHDHDLNDLRRKALERIGRKSFRRLDDITLNAELTEDQVLALWGPPDYEPGSGMDYKAYTLEDGRGLWLLYSLDRHVGGALLCSPNSGGHKWIFPPHEQ